MNRISRDDVRLEIFSERSDARLRNLRAPEEGVFIAESAMVIARALDAGYVPELILIESSHVHTVAAAVLERCKEVPVCVVSHEELLGITGYNVTRGILCAMRRRPLPAAEALCRNARRVVVLEQVMNPTNLGSVFRSAAAMGMDAVLLTEDCADPLYRRALRVSVGTVFQVPWTWLHDPALLRQMGFRTAAMALRRDAISLDDPRLKEEERLAVLLGSEGYGLQPETVAASDYVVRIPMREGVDSLNVAAAGAVVFWELRRI